MNSETVNKDTILSSDNRSESTHDNYIEGNLNDSSVKEMLIRLSAQEAPHFKHQSRQEAALTVEEKIKICSTLFHSNPGQFLARYSRFLTWPTDSVCFANYLEDETVRFYLQKVGLEPCQEVGKGMTFACEKANKHRQMIIKNRRYRMMLKMQQKSDQDPTEGFFSHERMRERDPELWENMVGAYLKPQDRRALLGLQYESFSGMLLSQTLESETGVQTFVSSDDDEEKDFTLDNSKSVLKNKQANIKNKNLEMDRRRKEYMDIMHLRFVVGDEKEVNYSSIDNDESLDDNFEYWRDAEESYFDSESPNEVA